MTDISQPKILRRIRFWLIVFIIGLVISGLTAFPLRWEVDLLYGFVQPGSALHRLWPALAEWIGRVNTALNDVNARYPFLFYGTDWLAFAHLVIAVAFWGPLRDPVKNIWVIQFGMIACVMVIPLALIAGPIRGIPWWWRAIDCSFGVFGILPLWLAYRDAKALARSQTANSR